MKRGHEYSTGDWRREMFGPTPVNSQAESEKSKKKRRIPAVIKGPKRQNGRVKEMYSKEFLKAFNDAVFLMSNKEKKSSDRITTALGVFNELLMRGYMYGIVHKMIGCCMHALQDHEGCVENIKIYLDMLGEDELDAIVYQYLARSHYQLKQYREAVASYRKYEELTEGEPNANRAMDYLWHGISLYHIEEVEKAYRWLEKAESAKKNRLNEEETRELNKYLEKCIWNMSPND